MFKYVHLWYFTREGLEEAASVVRIADEVNEPLTIAREDEGTVTLKLVHTVGPSKNVKPDNNLSFSDFLFAKNIFLRCIEDAKWGNDVVDSYNWFFHKLETHELRHESERGEKALVNYAAHVRQDWHDKMNQKCGFNIANINEELVAKFVRQLDSQEVRAGLEKVMSSPSAKQSATLTTCSRKFTTCTNHRTLRSRFSRCYLHCCFAHMGVRHPALAWTFPLICFGFAESPCPSSNAEIGTALLIPVREVAPATDAHPSIASPTHAPIAPLPATDGPAHPTGNFPARHVTGPDPQSQPARFSGTHPPPARCAWDAMSMMSQTARRLSSGTSQPLRIAPGTNTDTWSIKADTPCAGIFNAQQVATAAHTSMNALGAETKDMAQTNAPEHNVLAARQRSEAHTPYIPNAWKTLLSAFDLSHIYPAIPESLHNGFNVHAPCITHSFTPPNNPSISMYSDAFHDVINKEFLKGRYIGPFSLPELEKALGPVQSSPLSIIPKPGKPGKYRLIQNLSYPHEPNLTGHCSINAQVDSADFPCTWGTFNTICSLVASLPPGSQGATRDVAEAYRTIPLRPSQWPSLVVKISEVPPLFAVDTALCFGYGPSAGVYGELRDAGLDIMRAAGIGPVVAWVDDHLFFRLSAKEITSYNTFRSTLAHHIQENGGLLTEKGRIWFKGRRLADGSDEEFAEDCRFPIKQLDPSATHLDMPAYSFKQIDSISDQLGIPWELSKDTEFSSHPVFLGFEWDLDHKTVKLTETKCLKYVTAIKEWLQSETHTLSEVEKLHGKLVHASLVIPEGAAYITSLQRMLGLFGNQPFMPRTQPRGTVHELNWWLRALESPCPTPIPHSLQAANHSAFSDASSGVGIAIIIGDRWRAWHLRPGWNTDSRDIGWAESIGFKFLIATLLTLDNTSLPLSVHGDNQGVIDAWRKGRSRNMATNATFRRIFARLRSPPRRVFAHYVPSKQNPADGPSRGIYPSAHANLPRIMIPAEINHLIFDYDDPACPCLCLKHQL